MNNDTTKPPGSGNGGIIPPVEHRFKPGQCANPLGRKTAGATIREWCNILAEQELTETEIRRIARDVRLPWPKRAAAERILRTLEYGDIGEMEKLLNGEVTLEELKKTGINTEVIKRVKTKRRTLPNNGGEEIEREIELHDRAGGEFDRICDRTEGKPRQTVDVNQSATISAADGAISLDTLVNRVKGRIGANGNGVAGA
jgi:hypothetical protein